jgi:peptidoglycan/LPS O-acetylase OafA/YrhL
MPDRTPQPAKFRYEPALDGLRALAVLAIIAYHFNYSWARGAYLSVDLFFILSGFLITMLLIMEWRGSDTIALRRFWARRARRLLPALLLVLAFVAVFTHFEVEPWNRAAIRGDGIASLFYVANWRFIVDKQGYFELFSAASPLRHMWTLAIEEQFYLVWPLVVFAVMRVGRGSLRVLAGAITVGIAASVAVMAATYGPGDPLRAYYGTDARAHTILIGALLAVVLAAWKPGAQAARRLTFAGAGAFVVMLFAWNVATGTSSRYYHGGSVAYAVLACIVIACSGRRSLGSRWRGSVGSRTGSTCSTGR